MCVQTNQCCPFDLASLTAECEPICHVAQAKAQQHTAHAHAFPSKEAATAATQSRVTLRVCPAGSCDGCVHQENIITTVELGWLFQKFKQSVAACLAALCGSIDTTTVAISEKSTPP